MTVINPNSISGITSITLPSGGDNVLTIHTNDGTERFRIDSSGNIKVGTAATISPDGDVFFTGVCTATTLAGSGANLTNLPAANVTGTLPAISGANLTNLPAANLTGTLPAISGANLTGIAATDNVRTGILDVAGIATFRDNVNVPNINGGQIGGRRNIIINGAMQVAQRATSSTTSGYGDLDRWKHEYAGTDESPTFAQSAVVSSDSGDNPFAKGISKCTKITNGNQTGGFQNNRLLNFNQQIEAQDMRGCGWNYNSSSSFITLSYYVKASVAQEYFGFLKTVDGTNYIYPFSLGSLSANTWTKITKSIPGNSNLQIDDNNGSGFQVFPIFFGGTDYTDSGVTNDAWATWSSSERSKDQTSTWWTTNDSTIEITGIQLEVGAQATPFEHRSYGEEHLLCQRYYEELHPRLLVLARYSHHDGAPYAQYHFKAEKRAAPTCSHSGTFVSSTGYAGNPSFSDTLVDSTDIYGANTVTAGGILYVHDGGSAKIKFDAEI